MGQFLFKAPRFLICKHNEYRVVKCKKHSSLLQDFDELYTLVGAKNPTAQQVLDYFLKVIVGWITTSILQIFNKEAFCLISRWMCSLLFAVYETSTFF